MDYPKSVPSVGLVDGKFVDEDALAGTPGSLIPAQWGNAVTEEMLNVLMAAGLAPDELNNSQLLLAISRLSLISTAQYAVGTAAGNALSATYAPAVTALTDGMVLKCKSPFANTAPATFNPNGLGAKPIVGGGHNSLQGGEIVANSELWLQYNISVGGGSWVIVASSGGAAQVAQASKSQHAMQLGQAVGRLIGVQTFTANGTYTPTSGTTSIVVEAIGGGGGGGGTSTPPASNQSAGAGGGGGSYSIGRFTTGFSGASVSIGAAGAGGSTSSGAGGNGGSTSLGALISAGGGNGAPGSTSSASTTNTLWVGGAGGTSGSGGNIFSSAGAPGGYGYALAGSLIGGVGGSSGKGASASGPVGINNAGNAGIAKGVGGGGGCAGVGSTFAGGAGAAGLLVIYEYA
ncbi:hypothetical protein [Pseudomonas fluorescens]|uniref:hypothetical protein n=1 Tax=Pseudomonas fluorescens TaxID=294 RepID=UPI0030DAB485